MQATLISLLEIVWSEQRKELAHKREAQMSFETLLGALVELHNTRAIVLSQQLASSRG